MLKAAIYARYSSSLQRPTSIEDQVARCRAAASRFECKIADAHVYKDQEISGATAHRPGYQRLTEAAKRHEFDAIIVEDQDRLWRDQAEMHAALKRLRFQGIKVFSVATGANLTDKTGSIVAAVKGWQDEAFLDSLREKTRRGMEGQIARGLSAGGRAYGYRSLPILDHTHRSLQPAPCDWLPTRDRQGRSGYRQTDLRDVRKRLIRQGDHVSAELRTCSSATAQARA